MNNPDHISESLEAIFGLKYLNSLMRIRIRDLFDPGARIRDKHSGFATLYFSHNRISLDQSRVPLVH